MTTLTVHDFGHFFRAIHGHDPFPWQQQLTQKIADEGRWPDVLDLPTGSGKTAAIDIAVFHLALEAERGPSRRAPLRIAFVVDRRLVVDDAFFRAQKIAEGLATPQAGSAAARVAERLKLFSHNDRPLIARRLRGGVPREGDWARTPAQPTVLCSTVDQIGSRLLFRGYGVSDRMKSVHAGLVGADCLILLDEAHLAEPFRQTLAFVGMYRGEKWRDGEKGHSTPWGISLLTATPGQQFSGTFGLSQEDHANDTLARRLDAKKPARLISVAKSRKKGDEKTEEENQDESRNDLERIVEEVRKAVDSLRTNGVDRPALGIVLNRVGRARAVFKMLDGKTHADVEDLILLIGPSRPVDRDRIVNMLGPIRTRTWQRDEARTLEKSIIVVATQCIEAGVDIDLDGLISEIAPLDALRQRFGRLNRAGREIKPYAAIVTPRSALESRHDDPIYGRTMKPTWEYLTSLQNKDDAGNSLVDFGINAFQVHMNQRPVPPEAVSQKDDAPVLLPAHLDLFSQTAPVPAADPEVSLYLHGNNRQPDSITVIWRADLDRAFQSHDAIRRLLLLVPPRATEAIELPRWAVRRWLEKSGEVLGDLADIAAAEPKGDAPSQNNKDVFRWKGDDTQSRWVTPGDIRSGDTIVIPSNYGGLDRFGWNPDESSASRDQTAAPVVDVGHEAALPFSGRRFVVRIAPGLLGNSMSVESLAEAFAASPTRRWEHLRDAVAGLALPQEIQEALAALDRARGKGGVKAYEDLYGYDHDKRPRGVVFVAQFGLEHAGVQEDGPSATEDDVTGSLPGFLLTLEEHSADVERKAEEFAERSGLPPDRVNDLKIAGYLHDAGKVDPRFQSWLHYGDPLGLDPGDPQQVLAKSSRLLPQRAREASGLPENWRHEAFSVRLAINTPRFAGAKDPELVLWLVGVHHGYGRPFFPHQDSEDANTRPLPHVVGLPDQIGCGYGPQSLAFDWNGLDWATMYERLKARYGIWALAQMEAILRLADHRASEEAANRKCAAGEAE